MRSSIHIRYKSQSNTTSLLFLKLHSRQHVSALQSHHQNFLMNRSKINIYSAFEIPSVYIDGTVSIIVLWSDTGIYIHCTMFTVCKSVHHRTIQINHQPDATIFQFIILTFIYSSTSFGRFPAHHQELNDCSGSLWFYLHIVVIVVLCSWWGRPARPRTQHGCHHDTKVKLEAATAVIELLMMGGKTPETCSAVNKRQDNKLKNCCIWLVIYLNCRMCLKVKNRVYL